MPDNRVSVAAPPKAIAATPDPELFAEFTRVAGDWQHRAGSLTQLWQEVGSGTLDPASALVVLDDRLPEGLEAIAAAIAAIPATTTVVLAQTSQGSAQEIADMVARRTRGAQQRHIVLDATAPHVAVRLGEVLSPPAPIPDPSEHAAAGPSASGPSGGGSPDTAHRAPVLTVEPEAPGAALSQDAVVTAGDAHAAAMPVMQNFDRALLDAEPIPDQETIVVVSSKGGVGKSSSAVSLATAIKLGSRRAMERGETDREARVLLVDMDVRDGQLGTFTGAYTPTALAIRRSAHVVEHTIRDAIVTPPHLGVDVLLAPNRPRASDDCGPTFYRSLIRALKRMYDVIVMDGSVNYLDPLLGGVCMPEATRILLVADPFRTSVHGVSRAIRELTEPTASGGLGVPRGKIGLVVNKATGDVDVDTRELVASTQDVRIVASIPAVPQSVMLEATNTARMDTLLTHPALGPAYFSLARKCAPKLVLAPLETAVPPAGVGDGGQVVAPVRPVVPVGYSDPGSYSGPGEAHAGDPYTGHQPPADHTEQPSHRAPDAKRRGRLFRK